MYDAFEVMKLKRKPRFIFPFAYTPNVTCLCLKPGAKAAGDTCYVCRKMSYFFVDF